MDGRKPRYQLEGQSLKELQYLHRWLRALGAGRRDAIFMALVERIAELERNEARGKAFARRSGRNPKGSAA